LYLPVFPKEIKGKTDMKLIGKLISTLFLDIMNKDPDLISEKYNPTKLLTHVNIETKSNSNEITGVLLICKSLLAKKALLKFFIY